MKKERFLIYAAAVLMCLLMFSGCGKGYEPVEAPSLEAAGQLTSENGENMSQIPIKIGTENEQPGSVESACTTADGQAGISAREELVTMETASAFITVDEEVYVTGDRVNVRKSAGTDGAVIAAVSKGTVLKRTGYNDSWSRVICQEQECYISSGFVSKEKPAPEAEPAAPAVTGSGKIVAIDPGHQAKGNSEKEPVGPGALQMKAKVASGTQGVATGIPEYKLTLAVSEKLKAELINRGYRVYMIRETNDVNISNAERAEMANKSGADIFVRVHANSLDDAGVHGTLAMCQTSKNIYNGNLYGKSSALSKAVVKGICDTTEFKNCGVQESDAMSGINWCKIPVTIVEVGFMSNAREDKKMAEDGYREKIAKGIADGIDAYYAAGN